jgi:nucleotide-binding universal stress UspA family protein
MIQRVLVGTDFSASADHALNCAVRLARGTGANVVIVHVEPPGTPPASGPHDAVRDALDSRVALASQAGGKCVSYLVADEPAKALARLAHQLDVDLVAIGTHGQRRPGVLVGSVAERLIRMLARPVLVVPLGPRSGPEPARTRRAP